MRLKEQRLWDRFKANVGRAVSMERVENLLAAGFPDVLCIAPGGVVSVVELKAVAAAPVRPATPVLGEKSGLSKEQRNWHMNWTRNGGRSFFLVGVGSAINLLVPGKFYDELNAASLEELHSISVARSWAETTGVLKG